MSPNTIPPLLAPGIGSSLHTATFYQDQADGNINLLKLVLTYTIMQGLVTLTITPVIMLTMGEPRLEWGTHGGTPECIRLQGCHV
jgi:hypothetical protein